MIKEIECRFKKMNDKEKNEFCNTLTDILFKNNPITGEGEVHKCPHCNSDKIKKNGKVKEIQKYKCNYCNKEFRASTNTAFYYLKKKDCIWKYVKCMLQSKKLRETAREVNISLHTAFDWRHKILESISFIQESTLASETDLHFSKAKASNNGLENRNETLSSDIPINDKDLNFSFIYSKHGKLIISAISKGDIDKGKLKEILNRNIPPHLTLNYSASNKITSIAKHKIDKINSIHSSQKSSWKNNNNSFLKLTKLEIWLETFYDIANKYHQHYFNWFVLLNSFQSLYEIMSGYYSKKCISVNIWSNYWDIKEKHVFSTT